MKVTVFISRISEDQFQVEVPDDDHDKLQEVISQLEKGVDVVGHSTYIDTVDSIETSIKYESKE